jgi:hypothetical protein
MCSIAPDVYHKDNVSGGTPYAIELPNPGADALVFGEWHHLRFVPYLRIAILDWGGFPGLSHACSPDQWRAKHPAPPAWLGDLTHDLVAF